MTNNHLCDPQGCFLCQCCLKDWLPAIDLNRKNILVKRGQLLFEEGDPVNGIFFVASGILKVHKRWIKEKEMILRFAKGGDIIGHLGLGSQPTYPVSATAIDQSSVCYVDMDFFNTSLNVNHQLSIKMMHFFANELQESEKRMRNQTHMSVRGRVAQALISLKNQFGLNDHGFVNVEITRQDLASYSGAVYESLFRTINDLTEKGLATITGKSIMIINEAMLMKLIEEDGL
ncbi:Crp/Fnr family transcriptional regulator [Mucilaginibacter sp.]|uniref:Crp/Fnr family transcriptional regulator n=1 Tax=Mucilaginibacter sp. TaxID=1882438 RepID=UPI00374D7C9E